MLQRWKKRKPAHRLLQTSIRNTIIGVLAGGNIDGPCNSEREILDDRVSEAEYQLKKPRMTTAVSSQMSKVG